MQMIGAADAGDVAEYETLAGQGGMAYFQQYGISGGVSDFPSPLRLVFCSEQEQMILVGNDKSAGPAGVGQIHVDFHKSLLNVLQCIDYSKENIIECQRMALAETINENKKEIAMGVLSHLQPERVFYYFEEICKIPHGSYHTDAISDYCMDFARDRGLRARQDESGNVIIWKEASPGYENGETVILQGHLDMVCVKEDGCPLDLEKDGLHLVVCKDELFADGTSLGGDDGIAVAYALAILEDDAILHPALEVVLTVNEEVGMLGATALDASDLKGRVLLNLDSEDEGIFLTGCAGGATVSCKIPVKWTKEEGIRYRISIENLTGGHSGAEIHKGRANANVLMGRLLYTLTDEMNMWIASLAGGEKDNAIARFCHAEVAVAEAQAEAFERCVEKMAAAIKREYALREPEACIYAEKMGRGSAQVLQPVSASRVILALVHMPDGVQKMEEALKGEVRTSLNLGQIALSEECFTFVSSVRSSLASEKTWLLEKLQSLAMLLGGECVVSGEYPAWEYRPDSRIRELIVRVYEEQTGKKAKICSIHAGLECGILADKLPGLDCVSYGPQKSEAKRS